MADHEVLHYTSRWNLKEHQGRISLIDSANNVLDDRVYSSPDEFQLVVGILRHEAPVLFDDVQEILRTRREPVGENE